MLPHKSILQVKHVLNSTEATRSLSLSSTDSHTWEGMP